MQYIQTFALGFTGFMMTVWGMDYGGSIIYDIVSVPIWIAFANSVVKLP